MRNPEFERMRKEIWTMMVEHPLQDSYEAVIRGEKSWKGYHEDLLQYLKKEEGEPAYFAMEHVLEALRKNHDSVGTKEFWETVDRITTYYPVGDTMVGPEYLARIHKEATRLAKQRRDLRKMPEFWRALAGTSVVDILPPETVADTARLLRETARTSDVMKNEALRRALLDFAEELKEHIKFTREHKNMQKTKMAEIWAAEENLEIAARLLKKLGNKRP